MRVASLANNRPGTVLLAGIPAWVVPVGFLAFLALGSILVAYFLLRRSRGGVLPGWREPLLDPSLPRLDAGTPEEWLAGRGALGGGAAGSAALKAAAVRSAWWEPQPTRAARQLRWRVDPDPDPRTLARATKKGLRAARRALPGRGQVRIVGDLERKPGPDLVAVRLVVEGQTDTIRPWLQDAEDAFVDAFEGQLGSSHHLTRVH